MKVELQSGDRITIPEGCKAQINGNEVVVEKEGKSEDFNRGDILVSLYNDIILVDDYDIVGGHLYSFVHIDRFGDLCSEPYFRWNERHNWRLATEDEKQLLFDKMKEQKLLWNAEEKRIKKIRWRAEDGKEYYYVGNQGNLMVDKEDGVCTDKNRYEYSNYFRTSEQAEEAAKRVKEVLCKFHEEIGE